MPVQGQMAANGGHLFSGKEAGSNNLFIFTPENWSNTKPDDGKVYTYRNGQYYIMPEDFD
jgi:hypothetical protein